MLVLLVLHISQRMGGVMAVSVRSVLTRIANGPPRFTGHPDHPVEIGGIFPAIWTDSLLNTKIEEIFTVIFANPGKSISP